MQCINKLYLFDNVAYSVAVSIEIDLINGTTCLLPGQRFRFRALEKPPAGM